MTALIHFAADTDMVSWDGAQPACGNDFRHTKKLTGDPAEVTCRTCRQLCGFDEQLAEVRGDPFLRRRAA